MFSYLYSQKNEKLTRAKCLVTHKNTVIINNIHRRSPYQIHSVNLGFVSLADYDDVDYEN